MEITAHFDNIKLTIIDKLLMAQNSIEIAVTWFTNEEIFQVLLKKAREISVSIIILNDDINNKTDGIDFQKFIDYGGNFYFAKSENPMHNKFCIIDKNVLITGSYNYTYLAESINNENIIIFRGSIDIINEYSNEFLKIISNLERISSIKDFLKVNPSKRNTFSYANYGLRDMYEYTNQLKISGDIFNAKKILSNIENSPEQLSVNNFQINDVIYKQWKQEYYTDKIQVLNNKLILFYRIQCDNKGFYIHGPKTKYAWILRNSVINQNFRKAERISNIKINGNKLITSTEEEEIYYFAKEPKMTGKQDFGYELNENNYPVKNDGHIIPVRFFKVLTDKIILTFEIHFSVDNFPMETVDLIEGLGTENKNHHWHSFDINLKLNREIL